MLAEIKAINRKRHELPLPGIQAFGQTSGAISGDQGLGLGISPGGSVRSQHVGGGAKLRSAQQLLRRQPQPDRGINSVRAIRISQKRRVMGESLRLWVGPSVGFCPFRNVGLGPVAWGLVVHSSTGIGLNPLEPMSGIAQYTVDARESEHHHELQGKCGFFHDRSPILSVLRIPPVSWLGQLGRISLSAQDGRRIPR